MAAGFIGWFDCMGMQRRLHLTLLLAAVDKSLPYQANATTNSAGE